MNPTDVIIDIESQNIRICFKAALNVLFYIVGYIDPDKELPSTQYLIQQLNITNDSRIVESAFKILNHPETQHEIDILLSENVSKAITIVNNINADDSEAICLLAQTQLHIETPQTHINDLLIKLPKKKKGAFRQISGMLVRHAHMLATEVPSALAAGGLSIFAKSDWDPKNPICDPDKPPILFIHGLKHNQSGWAIGAEYLKRIDKSKSLGSKYYISYDKVISNSWDKAIDDFVAIVSGKICEIRATTGHEYVVLVGHSLGGIIASRYAETHQDCKDVITIGSPFKGSHVASIMMNEKKRFGLQQREIDNELAQNSESLKQIYDDASTSDWTGNIRYYNIRSTTDELVPKESTIVTKDPRRILTLESTGHIGLMFMPKVWDKIYDWIVNDIYK